ncbi:two-component system sensor histidine kinase YesM [Paenibacillus prosopidis]|uniref:Two-component system sensor histidine kinase YesM n=2 Tax=Paenibacillus prosopidis TaxID=630520 RepID=A0A368W7F7_9BACL|nr:two-component system sensor histidine kinase YesM [Paenibacillus prosopidis]
MEYLKKLPIRVQLSMLVIIIIVIVIFIIFTNYFKAANVVEKKNEEYFTEMISQMNQTLSSNSDVVKRIIQNISYNSPIVQQYLTETNPAAKFVQYNQLKSYISDMTSMKDGILDIALIGSNGTKFNINGDISNLVPLKDEIPEKQLYYFTALKTLPFNNENKNVFIAGAQIYSIDNLESTKAIGTLLVVMDANALLGSSNKALRISGSKAYALDRNGNVFFTNDDEIKPGSAYPPLLSLEKDGDVIIQKGAVPDIGGEIIFKLPKSELLSGIEEIRKQSFLIFFISLLLLAIPFFLVINNILQPLKKLMRLMNEIKLGKLNNLRKRISLQGYAEIIIMANDFNEMLDEIDDLTHRLLESKTRLYEAELVKKQSEMAYLQSQINPHFLYNTLESINGIAAKEGADKIYHMTKALSLVFRYSVKGTDTVPLREELAMIKSFIYIQKIRFGNRFEVKYHFPEEILEYRVPKMILQPIVENAIFHGIEPKSGEVLLELAGEISGDMILLTVKDNGMGMDDEKLRMIMNSLSAKQGLIGQNQDWTISIGLANVNNRVKLKYGNEYGIIIESEPGLGTEVVIMMPGGSDSDV